MATKEVNPNQLINELAGVMKEQNLVQPPPWSSFVKTGAHTERLPDNPDWWYVRAASILRQIYMRGPIGVEKLRDWYGGRKNRGARPERHRKAGGKIIRLCLQQLEGAGLVSKEGKGRKFTAKGQSLIDKTASGTKPRREAPAKKPKAEAEAPAKKAKPKAKAKAAAKEKAPKAKEEAKPKTEKPKAKPKAKPKEEKPMAEPKEEKASAKKEGAE